MPVSIYKKLFYTALAATVLTLSACDKKDEATIEGSAQELDSETSESEAAAEIAAANAPMISDREENPILPNSDEPENTGTITGDTAPAAKDTTGGVGRAVNPVVLDNEVKQTPTSNNTVEAADVTNDNSSNNSDMVIEETSETY